MNGKRLDAVDGLRALAVLAVVVHHAGLNTFGLGTRGVDLFFVISGFCLSLPTLSRMHAGEPFRFDIARFARGRVKRIAPPYYAALGLFGILSLTSFGVPTVASPPGQFEWIQDAAFLTSTAPSYNASFWTLGVEARWYLIFPVVLALYARSKLGFAAIALGAYALYAWQNALVDAGTLPCFMLGIVAADVFVRGHAKSFAFVVAAAVAIALAVVSGHGDDPGNPAWHVASFLVVVAGVGALSRVMALRPLAFFGVASYSIYLVHQPILYWLASFGWPLALCAVCSVIAGLAFWRTIELPSQTWRVRTPEHVAPTVSSL
jgi:peptidoglycan/LPS O-acetylase OafA/YrhL